MSHSIDNLSIQIDTKSLKIRSTILNCPSLQAIYNGVLHFVSLLNDVRFLDTLITYFMLGHPVAPLHWSDALHPRLCHSSI